MFQIDEVGSYKLEIEKLRKDVERLEVVADGYLSRVVELEAENAELKESIDRAHSGHC